MTDQPGLATTATVRWERVGRWRVWSTEAAAVPAATWIETFERLVADKGLLEPGAVSRRHGDFKSGRRDDVF